MLDRDDASQIKRSPAEPVLPTENVAGSDLTCADKAGSDPLHPSPVAALPLRNGKTVSIHNRQASERALAEWAMRVVGLQRVHIQARLQANNLHFLCQGPQFPHEATVINRLIQALATTQLAPLLCPDQPELYQIYVYGRAQGNKRPDWAKIIFLNQLERHLAQIRQQLRLDPTIATQTGDAPIPEPASPSALPDVYLSTKAVWVRPASDVAPDAAPDAAPGGETASLLSQESGATPSIPADSAIVISNRSLAKQGQAEAIARYLSETLSGLGIAITVKVEVRARKIAEAEVGDGDGVELPLKRICIYCEASYSPDSTLLADRIAEQLRSLELTNFRDALIFHQVIGESTPEWVLRVDLTPPDQMLRHLARWGDTEALVRWLNRQLIGDGIHLTASQKQANLHLFCELRRGWPGSIGDAEKKQRTISRMTELLESLAPQGIYAAFLYGQVHAQKPPLWVEWFKLPASLHPALREPTAQLAQQGDLPALEFCLTRLLNPDLDQQLATGGIRVQLRQREDLLHVMVDAPLCPEQNQVTAIVVRYLRKLKVANVFGVRIYGRRAGQKQPTWSYGLDFQSRRQLLVQSAPEFAATENYLDELLPADVAPIAADAELPTTDGLVGWSALAVAAREHLRRGLVATGLFVAQEGSSPIADLSAFAMGQSRRQRGAAVVWGLAGLVLALQSDWIMNQVLLRRAELGAAERQSNRAEIRPLSPSPSPSPLVVSPSPGATIAIVSPMPKANQPIAASPPTQDDTFPTEGFTKNMLPLPQPNDTATFISPPADASTAPPVPAEKPFSDRAHLQSFTLEPTPYPEFQNPLMDRQLALYYQRFAKAGPPDVLIVGSSRALRGVDPLALEQVLAQEGYSGMTVFNLGVNGATAQVVDLLVRRVLTPDQLPKIIIWADGARAFNSGRPDRTYKAMTQSKGYQKLALGEPLLPPDKLPRSRNQLAAQPQQPAPVVSPVTQLTSQYQAMDRRLSEAIFALSATYNKREQLKALLREKLSQLITAPPSLANPNLAASVVDPNLRVLDETMQIDKTDFDGFLPLSVRFNPATYYQKHPRVSGDYDTDYAAFRMEGEQAEALAALANYAQQQKVSLVFVNLPLTQEYLDAVRRDHEQEFQKYMLKASTQLGFTFIDMAQKWPTEQNYFSDPSHLNRYGAYAVSAQLARNPLLPWFKK